MHHLSNMAPFRRARIEANAHRQSTRSLVSSDSCGDSQPYLTGPEVPFSVANTSDMGAIRPLSLPSFGSVDSPAVSLSHNPEMAHTSVMHTSIPDYIRTAEEMSQYLTWDMSEWCNQAN